MSVSASGGGGAITVFDAGQLRGEACSDLFVIYEDQALLLSAFGMPDDGHVYTERVITNVPAPETWGNPQSPLRPIQGYVEVRNMRPVIGGADNWIVDKAHPQALIALPGSYRFVLSDENMLAAPCSDLLVTAQVLRLSALPWLGALVLR
jgi:hypothetical protein